jgi:hypothetical protein
MDATSTEATIPEKREALAQLTVLLTLQAALTDRLAALIETRNHPSADVVAWDNLITEANFQREQMADRIHALQSKLGINFAERVH